MPSTVRLRRQLAAVDAELALLTSRCNALTAAAAPRRTSHHAADVAAATAARARVVLRRFKPSTLRPSPNAVHPTPYTPHPTPHTPSLEALILKSKP